MNDNSDLYDLAEQNGTTIECFELPQTMSTSVMFADGTTFIGIDPFSIETTAEERVHIAHELGHCKTGSFYNIHSNYDIRERHEHKANAWAIRYLIPIDELNAAAEHGIFETWDLAEHFGVTDDFMYKALDYYKAQHCLN